MCVHNVPSRRISSLSSLITLQLLYVMYVYSAIFPSLSPLRLHLRFPARPYEVYSNADGVSLPQTKDVKYNSKPQLVSKVT